MPTNEDVALVEYADEAQFYKKEVLKDYKICCLSREASLLARKEVLTGKAKFGITGDGKEVPQVAMARAFKKGDFRAGYYRDQTFMLALGLMTIEAYFAQLYADADNDPFSGGRQMNAHFATPLVDAEGTFLAHKDLYNSSSDVSCTAGQMARAIGLALASKKYRQLPALAETPFSNNGNEVCFCTIGDASTSEGAFWETINAAGVLQVPLAISVWDDGYGISVPTKYQTVKGSISEALAGFQTDEDGLGVDVFTVKGWDYPALCELYETVIEAMRATHRPAVIHVQELTQPQGHSTSGSHERYKSAERLKWEAEFDCNKLMRQWIIEAGIADATELDALEKAAKQEAKEAKSRAWKAYIAPVRKDIAYILDVYKKIHLQLPAEQRVRQIQIELETAIDPIFKDAVRNVRRMLVAIAGKELPEEPVLKEWLAKAQLVAGHRYQTHLYSETPRSALRVPVVAPEYAPNSPLKNGYEILSSNFDAILSARSDVFAFGEDVGKIGDVNQGFAGLQAKHGKQHVFDTGIREWTIMGQAIGMAMRGLRPIAEIQYLDYLIYALSPLSDDLATLRYRSNSLQAAPAIIRTRGHRLEGIWHAGSPMGLLINALRGIYVLVPRNMTQAAGFYNTMLQSDDPALIVECLNGYRLKERLPTNLGTFTVPLGIPEVLQEGKDITIVTYGSCVRVALEAIWLLEFQNISVELIDVQTLLPFDLEHRIVQSLKKTNRVLFLDEDLPGGASAYMLQHVLEVQGGYRYLDAAPATVTAQPHRPPYGSDGDYFSKPQAMDVFEKAYSMIYEAAPHKFRAMYFQSDK